MVAKLVFGCNRNIEISVLVWE